MPTAADAELLREVERVADRVRLAAPRLAGRGSSEAEQLAEIHLVLQQLADLAADAERTDRREVPAVGPGVLADQLTVLGRDLAQACSEPSLRAAQELLVALRRRL